MSMLTDDQVTEITDALEALRDDLRIRRWGGTRITAVVAAAAGTLTGHALMRAPVPQPAYFPPPPPYPYDLHDFSQDQAGPVPLSLQVTGRTKDELEENARQHGRRFYGADADVTVTLTGGAGLTQPGRVDDEPVYTCGAVVRQRPPLPDDAYEGQPRHPVRDTDQLLG